MKCRIGQKTSQNAGERGPVLSLPITVIGIINVIVILQICALTAESNSGGLITSRFGVRNKTFTDPNLLVRSTNGATSLLNGRILTSLSKKDRLSKDSITLAIFCERSIRRNTPYIYLVILLAGSSPASLSAMHAILAKPLWSSTTSKPLQLPTVTSNAYCPNNWPTSASLRAPLTRSSAAFLSATQVIPTQSPRHWPSAAFLRVLLVRSSPAYLSVRPPRHLVATHGTVHCSRPPWPATYHTSTHSSHTSSTTNKCSHMSSTPDTALHTSRPDTSSKWRKQGILPQQLATCLMHPRATCQPVCRVQCNASHYGIVSKRHIKPTVTCLSALHALMAKTQSTVNCPRLPWPVMSCVACLSPSHAMMAKPPRRQNKWKNKTSASLSALRAGSSVAWPTAAFLRAPHAWSSTSSKASGQRSWPTTASVSAPHVRSPAASYSALQAMWRPPSLTVTFGKASCHSFAPHASMATPPRCSGTSKVLPRTVDCSRPPGPVRSSTKRK
jgi:hypothetical protein